MNKFYFCNTIGDGSDETPFSPAISKYTDDFTCVDARTDATKSGVLMVECRNITQEAHTLALLDVDIIYFDVEDINLDDKVNMITDRQLLKDNLTNQGINIDGLTSDNTLREVLSNVVNQLLKRQNPNVKNIKNHYDN